MLFSIISRRLPCTSGVLHFSLSIQMGCGYIRNVSPRRKPIKAERKVVQNDEDDLR
jgi:hypothetical protein